MDFLRPLSGKDFQRAVQVSPKIELDPLNGNLIAAIVEDKARLCDTLSPGWTKEVPPLSMPYFVTSLRTLRLHLLKEAPVVFRRRNVFLDASLEQRL